MKTRLARSLTLALIVFALILGIGAGMILDRQVAVVGAQTSTTTTGPDFKLITEAWTLIDKNYVDKSAQQTKPMTYGAISGMVNALGDTGHSTFMTPEMVKSQRDYTRGAFEGIGAQVEMKEGRVVIVAPFDSSPAQKAGLRAGQAILKVDGTDMSGLAIDQVISRILGPAGTSVTLTMFDPKSAQTFDVTIARARIAVNNVTWQKLPGTPVAHLRLSGFSQGVGRQINQALLEMQKQGVTAVIFDLRNNPGGLLNEAVTVASQFLASGDALLEQDAAGQIIHVNVRPGGAATQMPVVVLINNGSASASEIVAGAIQDAQRGKLVGETTFGTGTVLNQFNLSDGSAMMLAIQQWLTPNGRVIWHKGIVPDVTVALPTGTNPLSPEAERDFTAAQLQASGDQQLLRALGLLTQSAQEVAPIKQANVWSDLPAFINEQLALELDLLKRMLFV